MYTERICRGEAAADINKKRATLLLSVYKAVFEKHAATGIAGRKREYESKGSYSFSAYSDKTAIGTLVFPENLL